MLPFIKPRPTPPKGSEKSGARHTVWIDGVGCFWLLLADRVTIGGPQPIAPDADASVMADVPLLSDLKRIHATIIRSGEGYLLEAAGPARVDGREVSGRTTLTRSSLIELGSRVRLQFQQPSLLSLTARLDVLSDHRPTTVVDGIVLLAETCLLGPGSDQHIVCPDWSASVLLVRQSSELVCRSRADFAINGQRARNGHALRAGDVVSGEDLRFRVE